MSTITSEQLQKWNGKNYNGSIYLDNKKVKDGSKFFIAQKMIEEYSSFVEEMPNYYPSYEMFSTVKKILEKAKIHVIVSLINNAAFNFSGSLLAQAAKHEIEKIIDNQTMPLHTMSVEIVIDRVMNAYKYSE